MKRSEGSEGLSRSSRLVWLVWLTSTVAMVVRAVLERAYHTDFNVLSLRSPKGAISFVLKTLGGASASFLGYMLIGIFLTLALTREGSIGERLKRCWLPALGGTLLLSIGLHWIGKGLFLIFPGTIELISSWLGCILGVSAAAAWSLGRPTFQRFCWSAVAVALLGAAILGLTVHLAFEAASLKLATPAVTSTEKRRVYGLFSGKHPFKLEAGKTAEVALTERDLNILLAWGLTVGSKERCALVRLAGSGASLVFSTPIPRTSRFLNVTAQGSASFVDGRLTAELSSLKIGKVAVPRLVLAVIVPLTVRAVTNDSRVKSVLSVLRRVSINSEAVKVAYGRSDLPKGFASELFRETLSGEVDSAAVRAQIMNLVAIRDSLPKDGEARFGAAIQAAFRYAKANSPTDSAVMTNRAAILALGIALGHRRVETLSGLMLDDATRSAISQTFEGTTLRKRSDWTKHFFVSAVLTVLASNGVSNAGGLFKEEKDAAGGSGFSFGDLIADRSGTTFAEVATHDESSARGLQERLASEFKLDDYFPKAEDLPENIQDAELESRYGGVGGEPYLRLTEEIERRVANCAAYKNVGRATE